MSPDLSILPYFRHISMGQRAIDKEGVTNRTILKSELDPTAKVYGCPRARIMEAVPCGTVDPERFGMIGQAVYPARAAIEAALGLQ